MLELLSTQRCFGGEQRRYKHHAQSLGCDMVVSVFLPPQASETQVPAVYYLSGLTCTDENFVSKAGAQRHAAALGLAIVAPDTSPRGDGVPDDPEGAWDFGLGAGFYINATQAPWSEHYHMYDYVVDELPLLVNQELPVAQNRTSIMGHSMGGHGALTIALKNPGRFCSVSAFSPIVAPSECPWGEKAFSHYLGPEREAWLAHDSCHLMRHSRTPTPMLVDQGDADNFLEEQLTPEKLVRVAEETGYPLELRMQPGYDHSYFFIASFMDDHLNFHAKHLKLK
jgi:S-formylglutathione hydrolase